jgi:hypothetical protein
MNPLHKRPNRHAQVHTRPYYIGDASACAALVHACAPLVRSLVQIGSRDTLAEEGRGRVALEGLPSLTDPAVQIY